MTEVFRALTPLEDVRNVLGGYNRHTLRFTRIYPDPSYRLTIFGELFKDGDGYSIRVERELENVKLVTVYRGIDQILCDMQDRDHNGNVLGGKGDRLVMAEVCSIKQPEPLSAES